MLAQKLGLSLPSLKKVGAAADERFIFTVDTTITGQSGSSSFILSVLGTNNFDVDWGDGSSDTGVTASTQHDYARPGGVFTITITGDDIGIYFGNAFDKAKITNIINWGNQSINFNGTFYGCSNLTSSATDAPIITTSDLRNTLRNCTTFNGSVTGWDVTTVNNFTNWCLSASAFQGSGLETWDIRNATSAANFMTAGGLTTANYDALLIQWDTLTGYPSGLAITFGSTQYSAGAAATARASLVTKGLVITDGGQA